MDTFSKQTIKNSSEVWRSGTAEPSEFLDHEINTSHNEITGKTAD